jgi:hypothetical protein
MDCWLQTGSLKKKENIKQDQFYDNKETDGATSTSGIKDKLQKKSTYDNSHLQFRFTCVGDSNVPDALCVLCYQTLGNSSMVPEKLQWHCTLIAKANLSCFLNINMMN